MFRCVEYNAGEEGGGGLFGLGEREEGKKKFLFSSASRRHKKLRRRNKTKRPR